MKTPKELVDKFIKSFGDNEIPIDEMYYNKSESTGINMRSFLEDFAEDISEQTKDLQEQLAASNSFLDKRCSENNELSVTIHKLEEQLAAKEKESSEAVRLNELMSGYSENQRKIILLLLDSIDSVKQFLPFSTNLELTEIINASEPFTKPLPTPPSKR